MYRLLLREDTDEVLRRINTHMIEVFKDYQGLKKDGYKITPVFDEHGDLKDFKFERIH